MLKFISILFLFFATVFTNVLHAQPAAQQDVMRSNGKIYVVMVVVLIIVTGLLLYVCNTDRKISKLEKEMKGKL